MSPFYETRCTRDADIRVALLRQRSVFRLNSRMKRSDFHLGKSQRVVVAGPRMPLHAVSVRWVITAQVGAVQVWGVAIVVPPGTFVCHGTRVCPHVVVLVLSAELVSTMPRQRITCKQQENTNQLYDWCCAISKQVCVQLPTSAVDVTLLAFAAELRRRCHCAPAVQQSINIKTDISCSPGAQQQTRSCRVRRENNETDGHRTVTRTLLRVLYARNANN